MEEISMKHLLLRNSGGGVTKILSAQGLCACRIKFSLAKAFSTPYLNSIKSAFTLAEVLITLGIIGVVAAMTLPAVINNTQNKQLETALKKAYSNLGQVTQLVVQEDFGGVIDARSAKDLSSYFVKYYKNSVICSGKSTMNGCPTNDSSNYCTFMQNTYKTYNGKSRAACVGNDAISNTVDSSTIYFDSPNFTQPGESELINLNKIIMVIDVNGWQKRPNKLGHDMFMFQIVQNGKLLPMGADSTAYPEDEYCSLTSTAATNGYGCTARAINEPDYFKSLPK